MMLRLSVWVPLALIVLGSCSGCLITHHNTRMVRDKEVRRPIQFETELAQQVFFAKFEEEKKVAEAGKNGKLFAIPFLLWYSRTDVLAENALFNDQAALCDVNSDGIITNGESLAYNPKFSQPAQHTAFSNGQPQTPAQSPYPTAAFQPVGPATAERDEAGRAGNHGPPQSPMY